MAVRRRFRVLAVTSRTFSSSSRKSTTKGASMSSSASVDGTLPGISRQHRQSPLRVRARLVPAGEHLNRKPVPEVVQPGAVARAGRPQARLPRQRVESSMNATDVEPRATIGNEHVVRAARAEKLFAPLKVVDQHGACGWMEGHEAGSTELGSPDREHALLEIDILE